VETEKRMERWRRSKEERRRQLIGEDRRSRARRGRKRASAAG
jgi:hypothetical protein